MAKNRLWLWRGYDMYGNVVGELEGTDQGHAREEFGYEFDTPVARTERVKGSGRPWPKVMPAPGTARFTVNYTEAGKRHKATVRTTNAMHAARLIDENRNDRRVVSVKRITDFAQ